MQGIIECTVCSVSGKLLTEGCEDYQTTQVFLEGTQPTEFCNLHSNQSVSTISLLRLEKEFYKSGARLTEKFDTTPLTVNLDFLNANYNFDEEENMEEEILEETNKIPVTIDYDYNYLME